MSGDKCGLS